MVTSRPFEYAPPNCHTLPWNCQSPSIFANAIVRSERPPDCTLASSGAQDRSSLQVRGARSGSPAFANASRL